MRDFEERIAALAEGGGLTEEALLALAADPSHAWPVRVFFSAARLPLLGLLPPDLSGTRVLEVGAGLGALTGELLARGASLTVCEPSPVRVRTLRARYGEALPCLPCTVEEIPAGTPPFDLVFVCGVLEYAAAREGGARRFLSRCRELLLPGSGELLVAIENRLGAKYLAGAGEDHTGRPGDGLLGCTPAMGVRTFTLPELEREATGAGLRVADVYGAWPDYKMPRLLLSRNAQEAGRTPVEALRQFLDLGLSMLPGKPRLAVADGEGLAGQLLACGLPVPFANSFVLRCSDGSGREWPDLVLDRSRLRREGYRKGLRIFPDRVEAVHALAGGPGGEGPYLPPAEARGFLEGSGVPILPDRGGRRHGPSLSVVTERFQERETLLSHLVRSGREGEEAAFRALLRRYREAASRALGLDGEGTVLGALDYIPRNLLLRGDDLVLFDCEFVSRGRIPFAFLLYRAAEILHDDLRLFLGEEVPEPLRTAVREELSPFGEEAPASFREMEDRFQESVWDPFEDALRRAHHQGQLRVQGEWVRDHAETLPALIERQEQASRELEERRLSLKYRAADRLDGYLLRVPPLRRLVRWGLVTAWGAIRPRGGGGAGAGEGS